jgi:hypothetical protein
MVTPLMAATMPAVTTCRRNSARLKRDNGRPSLAGSSQASAFTWATTRGGKNGRPTGAGTLLQPRESLLEEPFAPLAHHRARQVEALANDRILEALGGEQHDLGPHNLSIR